MWVAIAPQPWCPECEAPLQQLAAAITPVMLWREQALLLDVQASLQWLGGIYGLKKRVQAELAGAGIGACVAIALTAPGAWLLAVSNHASRRLTAWRYALSPRRLGERLDRVAIDWLPQAKPYTPWLNRVGCRHLGDLRALERTELSARTSTAFVKSLDEAYGQAVFEYQALKLPARFEQRVELPRLMEHANSIEPYLKRLLQALCTWLNTHRLAVSQLECRLHHRDRRRAWQPTVLILAVSEPSDSFAVLWRWLQTRLERTGLPAPVSDLGILTRTLAPRPEHNLALFTDDRLKNQSASETLDLLRARLGQLGVRQAHPSPDYRIEAANQWSEQQSCDHGCVPPIEWGEHCPAWLLSEPQPLAVEGDLPQLHGPLRLLHGPYRIETGWWDYRPTLRDYFVATNQSERRYWIYRERDQLGARWFLQGLFG